MAEKTLPKSKSRIPSDPEDRTIDGLIKGFENMGETCYDCAHLHSQEKSTCAAFPDGIPVAFITGEEVHDKPFPGDRGIMFTPGPGSVELDKDLDPYPYGKP